MTLYLLFKASIFPFHAELCQSCFSLDGPMRVRVVCKIAFVILALRNSPNQDNLIHIAVTPASTSISNTIKMAYISVREATTRALIGRGRYMAPIIQRIQLMLLIVDSLVCGHVGVSTKWVVRLVRFVLFGICLVKCVHYKLGFLLLGNRTWTDHG